MAGWLVWWRLQQIDKAVRTLAGWGKALDGDEDVEEVVGLGPKTVEKFKEIVATGSSLRMELVEADPKYKASVRRCPFLVGLAPLPAHLSLSAALVTVSSPNPRTAAGCHFVARGLGRRPRHRRTLVPPGCAKHRGRPAPRRPHRAAAGRREGCGCGCGCGVGGRHAAPSLDASISACA